MQKLTFSLTVFSILAVTVQSYALTPEEEIKALKEQSKILLDRIEKLESEMAKAKAAKTEEKVSKPDEKTAEKKEEPVSAMLKNLGTKLNISGRWAVGYLDSQKNGSFPNGSFQVPEAKVRLDFQPDKINTITMRMNLNNATFNNFDFFYLDSKDFIPCLKNTPWTLESRLGRFKVDYGEETWANNPVESIMISTSVTNVNGNDEGLQLSGKIKLFQSEKSINWSAAIMNGNSTTGADNENSKAFSSKIAASPLDALYLSASYYNSGDLNTGASEMSISGINTVPTNATNWNRKIWELDARYDFKKGKKPLYPPVYSDSKAIIRLAYGQFRDDAEDGNNLGAQDRDGQYGFIEGLYNINVRLYGAYRYSLVDLDSGQHASLNGINANKQQRHSLGLGWRWSDKTILKGEYTWNEEDDITAGTGDKNDQISAIVSSSF